MAKLTAMAPDSAGFKVLMRLYQLGGVATVRELTDTLWTEFRSAQRFHQIAGKPLTTRGLVRMLEDDRVGLTAEGRLMVESYKSLLPRQREAASPSSVLNLAKHFQYAERRPGSHGYREIPSVMGADRVRFASATQVDGAAEDIDVIA